MGMSILQQKCGIYYFLAGFFHVAFLACSLVVFSIHPLLVSLCRCANVDGALLPQSGWFVGLFSSSFLVSPGVIWTPVLAPAVVLQPFSFANRSLQYVWASLAPPVSASSPFPCSVSQGFVRNFLSRYCRPSLLLPSFGPSSFTPSPFTAFAAAQPPSSCGLLDPLGGLTYL